VFESAKAIGYPRLRPSVRRGGLLSWVTILLVGASVATAQERGVRFNRILVEDGLPSAEVRHTLQDRNGFIWLATGAGLSRYDGYEFITYRHDPEDPTSLPQDLVWTVLETQDGVLWVGTDGGLSRFDPVSRRFSNYRSDPSDPASLRDDRVRVLVEGPGGGLWLGTDEGGLARFDRKTARVVTYRHSPGDETSLSSDRVRDLVWDGDGKLWVATQQGGISVLDPATGRFRHLRHDPTDTGSLASDDIRRIYKDREGVLWVATYDSGLYRFDRMAQQFEPVTLGTAGSDKVTSILEDSAGTLWVGTEVGLFERLAGRKHFNQHVTAAGDSHTLPHDTVLSVFEDRGGLLWVGTRAGLATWNTRGGSFWHYFRSAETEHHLSNNFVTGFAEASDGAIWVATLSGLNRFDRETGLFEHYASRPGHPSDVSDDRVMSLLMDRSGTLWAGTLGGGLNRRDAVTGAFEAFVHDPRDSSSLSSNGVTVIYEDRAGQMWVGTYKGGLNRLDRETGRFERFRHDSQDPQSLSSDRVLSIHEDADGMLWIGTEDGGLNRFEPSSRTFIRYRHDPNDPRSLSSDASWFITSDQEGALWIATRDAGVNRWSHEDREQNRAQFRRFGQESGLANAQVYTILEANNGALWLSTHGGLSRLDPESESFVNFDETHGLQGEFNQGAAAKMRNGDLYFGGVWGFNAFSPDVIGTNPNIPPVVLTDFLVFNQTVELPSPVSSAAEISVDYRDSVIAFEFAALDYTAPAKNRFQYMLEGFDHDWVDAKTSHHATYTNLDPGRYVFRVRGSNNDGLWNMEGLRVGLHVPPPPWRSWWAHLLYAVAGGVVILLTVVSFERRRRRALELERINASLQREIEVRMEKERALEAEKRKAREYLDVAEVLMVALDSQGQVQLVNQKGCRVLGYEEAEIVGADWVSRFVPSERREEVKAILSRIEDHPYCEYPVITRTGEERVIAWHSTQLPSAGGEWVSLISGTDNTEVRALEKQVRMQQKMDALGTMAGGIAHDFNNILTAILGYSTLTLSQVAPESEEAGYLKHVVQGCERARDMVARILAFSRREETNRKPVEIGPILREACGLLRSSLPTTIEIKTTIDPDLDPVVADGTQIHQVLMNLGTNSWHAMREGGVLEIIAEPVEMAPGAGALDGELRSGRYVEITVSDTGHGMDKATLERIFDPFFTTKQVGEGTGLGLSVAHGIVKAHQGEISVRSAPGKGTSVVVRLPCAERTHVPAGAEEFAIGGGSERILLVDDETPIVLLAKKWLEDRGYAVEPHTDAVDALAAFRAKPRRYDLLIADQRMPEMEGLELVRQVRLLKPRLPVVMTSGRRFRRESEEEGCAWLQKPFTATELVASVRAALDAERGGLRSVS